MMLNFVFSLFLLVGPDVICSLSPDGTRYNPYSDDHSSPDALELAGKVNAALVSSCTPKCPRISMYRNPTALNLMLIRNSDQIKLVYKPGFFTTVYEVYGDGGILALIAHEVGHAIDTATVASWMKSNWNPELRADAWAGCALAKMNLSRRSLDAGLTALSKYPSPSHPDWNIRLPILQFGYTQCGGK